MIPNKVYNIVDSVKGGCGKTSFCIMMAVALAAKDNKLLSCILDMDIQGSALGYLLFGERNVDIISDCRRGKKGGPKNYRDDVEGLAEMFINDALLSHYKYSHQTMPKFLTLRDFFISENTSQRGESDEQGGTGKELSVYVAVANPDPSEKKRFRAVSSQNYSPEVTYSTFRAGLLSLLNKDRKYMENAIDRNCGKKIQQIFFDMPPNSDGYSDAVLDCVLNRKYNACIREKDDICNYFCLLTFDRGHINATLDWCRDFFQENHDRLPDHIVFVFNDMPLSKDEPNGLTLTMENVIPEFKKEIGGFLKEENDRSRIYFAELSFIREYFWNCATTEWIGNFSEPFPSQISHPILFFQPYSDSKPTAKTATDGLLSLFK